MSQWRIKEISDLTNVSVRMLHHYDKVGLLCPSVRASNGYRWYSEEDLAMLQQIIALRFFGFSLGQIKTMVQQRPKILDHLLVQEQMLKEQAEHLRQTHEALTIVLERHKTSGSHDWNDVITLIGRYHMIEELKKTWFSKLSEKQQDRYLALRQAHPNEVIAWEKMVEAINAGKLGDPEGPDGERAAKIFLAYTKASAAWGATQKALQETTIQDVQEAAAFGKMAGEMIAKGGGPLSGEGNKWFIQARIAYRLRRFDDLYQDIKKHLEADPESAMGKKLAARWCELIAEDCMGGTIEFFFGMKLLTEAVQTKIALLGQDASTPEQRLSIVQNGLKMISDPMVVFWIEKALKAK